MIERIKKVFGFLKWHWDNWSTSHRFYMLAAFLIGCGLKDAITGNGPNILMQAGLAILFAIFVKWFVLEPIRDSWNKYCEQRNSLLNTIKMSDKEMK
jgi:hypothetical protein